MGELLRASLLAPKAEKLTMSAKPCDLNWPSRSMRILAITVPPARFRGKYLSGCVQLELWRTADYYVGVIVRCKHSRYREGRYWRTCIVELDTVLEGPPSYTKSTA